jgi:tetratricopeptide (TPR) repeat protein
MSENWKNKYPFRPNSVGEKVVFSESKKTNLTSENRAHLLDKKNSDQYGAEGIALSNAGKFKEAIDAYESATYLAPYNSRWVGFKGLCYLRLGMYEQAITYFCDAEKLDNNYSDWSGYKGHAYERIGQLDLAYGSFAVAEFKDRDFQSRWKSESIRLLRFAKPYLNASKDYIVDIYSKPIVPPNSHKATLQKKLEMEIKTLEVKLKSLDEKTKAYEVKIKKLEALNVNFKNENVRLKIMYANEKLK